MILRAAGWFAAASVAYDLVVLACRLLSVRYRPDDARLALDAIRDCS